MDAINIFELSKEFISIKSIYQLVLQPFQKPKPSLAINNISLQVKQGEIFALIGQNGAGKTTLIKILSCLILPTKGKIDVMGCNILKDGEKIKASIGLVGSDERSFYWRLTLRQNLYFFAALYNLSGEKAKRKIKELSCLLEINNYLDKRFQECSSGIKQRLSIARSLLSDPGILFMDEPFKSLDLPSVKNLKNFIKKILVEEQHKTIFFISHNFNEVEDFADRIAIMHKGEIRACGTLNDLRNNISLPLVSLEDIYNLVVNTKGS
nr:ABC transporter ATP-binding protein [Candidatus Omnitrophota bacterium]